MGWLARLLGATPKEELKGIRLNMRGPFWELDGQSDFPSLLRALVDLLPQGSVLYFEGGSPNSQLLDFFHDHAIPEQAHIAVAVLWPRPRYYHVPATRQNLWALADLAESCAGPELAVHFHVYRSGKILLEWHDAFTQPMLLSGGIPEEQVRSFAEAMSMQHPRWKNPAEQARPSDA